MKAPIARIMIIDLIKKETLHVWRDKRMLTVVLLIPIVLMLLFGFAISMEINKVDVAVAWNKYDNDVRKKIDLLVSNPYISVKGSIGPGDVYETLRSGTVAAVVVFRDANDVQVITDASNPVLAQSGSSYIQAILGSANGKNPLLSMMDVRFLYNPQLKSAYNFVPGIMGMLFLLVCALMTAVSIVREKETGTMELLLVSPVRSWQIIVSKMLPFFVISCIDLTIILIIAIHILDVPISGGVLPVILISLLYILLSLGIGLFVSTISSNQVTAMLVCGMVMMLPVVMLSGMVYPIDNLPIILKQISAIVPARWYIDAMRGLMIEGLSMRDVLTDVIILAAMTLFFYLVSIKKFKNRLN